MHNRDHNRIATISTGSASRTHPGEVAYDAGLRSYMLRVYNYMSLGVAFTGAFSMLVAMNEGLVQLAASSFWLLFLVILGMGFVVPSVITGRSVGAAQVAYWAYAAVWGVILGPMLYAFAQIDPMMIAQAFFITAGAFAGMSLLGYTTKKNLSAMGSFLAMATIGVLITMLMNAFLFQDQSMSLWLSIAVVLIFSGLTAAETQHIKQLYYEGDAGDVQARKAIFGAFVLYGSFVTLFIHILNILGIMRSD